MPIFKDEDTASFKSTSGFKFSGVRPSKVGGSEQTLVGLAGDRSSSVKDFAADIEGCLVTSLEGCQKSPRADNLLARYITFASAVNEEHGFTPLPDCHLDKYRGTINPGGTTCLYDASVDLIDSMATYGRDLMSKDYTVNGIAVIITDGWDVGSTLKAKDVMAAIKRAQQTEALESLVTILIGINVQDPTVSEFLKRFRAEAGIREYIEAKDATAKTFAKVAGFIQQSVSSQSQAIGTGAASQPITF